MTDFRALCAELHAALDRHDLTLAEDQLLDRSAAALRAAGEKYIATQAARWGADQLRAARRPPAASAAGRGGGGMSQPLSPVEELQERYRSAADEYPDPDGFAAALRAVADLVVPEEQRPPRRGMRPGGTGALSPDEGAEDQRAATRRKLRAIADELENHQ